MSQKPHLFVCRGDISRIAADAIVIPTATRGESGAVFKSVAARLKGQGEKAFLAAYRDHEQRWAPLPVSPGPNAVGLQPRGAIIVQTFAKVASDAPAVRDAVKAALSELDAQRHRWEGSVVRLAMPAFGSAKGGGENALALAHAQVDELQKELEGRTGVDVVLVTHSAPAYARFVRKRRELWGDETDETQSRIAGLLRNERVVLFVGAGVSRGAGLPDWQQLIAAVIAADPGLPDLVRERWSVPAGEMTAELLKDASLAPDAYLAIADMFVRRNGRLALEGVVDALLSEEATRAVTPTLAQYLLLQTPVRYVVTTNFDHLLERTLRALRRTPSVVVSDRQVASSGEPGQVTVFKIHGSARAGDRPAQDIVLSGRDFECFANEHPAKAALLQALLLNHHFLFVGYSLSDPNLNQIRELVSDMLGGSQRRAWVPSLDPAPKGDSTATGLEWVHLASPRDLDIWLDRVAAGTADHAGTFLADAEWTGAAEMAGLHGSLRELAATVRALPPESDVRVMARVFEMLTSLGWRDPKDSGAEFRTWARLAQAAEGEPSLALQLWRRALSVAVADEVREAGERIAALESELPG